MFDNLRADLRRGQEVSTTDLSTRGLFRTLYTLGFWAVAEYRFARWAHVHRNPLVRIPCTALHHLLRLLVNMLAGINIPPTADIGPGLVIHGFSGIFIPGCRIGRNCTVNNCVTIEWNVLEIGDNCFFGAGCKVIGKTRLGNNVRVGANAVVLESVPDNCLAVGVPARIIPGRGTAPSTSEAPGEKVHAHPERP